MEDGKVIENDKPSKLMRNPQSVFYKLRTATQTEGIEKEVEVKEEEKEKEKETDGGE
ncbi:hypothetical protein FACS189472_09930 [Alphaproteobacteria bacterium]|nr:hypothetical protein FACS189472_09930 [Alphaproteobacteria bacterium]